MPSPGDALRPPPAALHPGAAAAAERGRETRERLLDAAEALFAERGFAGTSLRAVTRAAATSVSAANYHFGSKRALLREALRRRVEPMNARRLARLDTQERSAGSAGPTPEAILDAFVGPLFEALAERPEASREIRFVAARLYAESPELVAPLRRELFGEVTERFVTALGRALPGRPIGEIALAFQFAVGVTVHVLSGNLADAPGPPLPDRGHSPEDPLLAQLVRFLAAGMRQLPGGAA